MDNKPYENIHRVHITIKALNFLEYQWKLLHRYKERNKNVARNILKKSHIKRQ